MCQPVSDRDHQLVPNCAATDGVAATANVRMIDRPKQRIWVHVSGTRPPAGDTGTSCSHVLVCENSTDLAGGGLEIWSGIGS